MAASFKFRLQRLLELRRLNETESARHLSQAQRAVDEAQVAILELDEVRRESAGELRGSPTEARSAGELQRMQVLLTQIDEHIAEAGATLDAAQQNAAERVEEYNSAARLRQILDRLRDRQRVVWRAAVQSAEQKEIDEVAVRRHQVRQPSAAEA